MAGLPGLWCVASILLCRVVVAGQGDWLEVATPGKAADISFGVQKKGSRTVLDLTRFGKRLYVSLAPPREPSYETPILYFDVTKEDLVEEHVARSSQFGNFRVIGQKLFLPDATLPPVGKGKGKDTEDVEHIEGGGYYVLPANGAWKRIRVTDKSAAFFDIAHFDGKTFLAGSLEGRGVVAWRQDGDEKWQFVNLTGQAARWAPQATRFLAAPDHLSLLAMRRPDPDPNARAAPKAWGAWYVLHYFPKTSERGFLFDGPPRPLPALRLLAPGSQLAKVDFSLGHDVPFGKGLLYTTLVEAGATRDDKGALFFAEVGRGNPQVGLTLIAKRIAGTDLARDVAVDGDTCYVLLAANAQKSARIIASKDLESWKEVFSGELDATAVCLGVVDGKCFVGANDGGIVAIVE